MKAQKVELIKISDIELLENTRSVIEKEPLKELAASIKTNGLQQAVLVRPKGKKYQLIFGHRRVEAHKLLGLKEIKVVVETVKDEDITKLQLIENLQRKDITQVNEMIAIGKYYKQNKLTISAIAQYLGKPMVYVHLRIKGTEAFGPIQELFKKNKLQAELFFEIAKYPLNAQKYLYTEKRWLFNGDHEITSFQNALKAQSYLLNDFQFDIKDKTLFGGACVECPKRTGAADYLFAEYKKDDSCLEPECLSTKIKNNFITVFNKMQSSGKEFVLINLDFFDPKIPKELDLKGKEILKPNMYNKAKKGIPALVAYPAMKAGKVITVTINKPKEEKQTKEEKKATVADTAQELKEAKQRIERRYELAIYRGFGEYIKSFSNDIFNMDWNKPVTVFDKVDKQLFYESICEFIDNLQFIDKNALAYFAGLEEIPESTDTNSEVFFNKYGIKLFLFFPVIRNNYANEESNGRLWSDKDSEDNSDTNILERLEKFHKLMGGKFDYLLVRKNILDSIHKEFEKPLANHNAKWKDKLAMKELFEKLNKNQGFAYLPK